jgi:exosortase D (VPLPA-CTERM-specific)
MPSETKNVGMLYLSLITLVATFILLFHTDFNNTLIRWNHEDFSYCYLVPFLFLYLVYTNKEALRGLKVISSPVGFVILLVACLLGLMGRLGTIETVSTVGIWLAIVALAALILGLEFVRRMAFPFLVLFFMVPLPPFLNNLLTFRLKLISSSLSVWMMQVGGLSVYREGNIIDLGVTQLQVVDACSGLRYVYPLFLMGLVFGYLFHKSWWERVIVVAATAPISVLSNALRIAITGYLTLKVSPQAAEGFFHGFSGWLIFMVSFVFLAILSWLLKMMRKKKEGPLSEHGKNKRKGEPILDLAGMRSIYIWMAVAVLAGFWGLNTAMASSQIRPPRKTFEDFPTTIGSWKGEKTYIRDEILNQLWSDDYVQVEFGNTQTRDMLLVFVPYYAYQGTLRAAHSPVACLVGGGFVPRSRTVLQRDFPEPFGPVRIRQMILEKGNKMLLSNYWFQQRGRVIVSEYTNKWYMFWDSVTKRRTDGALVRLEMPLRPGQTVNDGQAVMDAFMMELMTILPEYVPN